MIKLPKDILTLADAGKKYGFHPDSLRNSIRRGKLDAAKRGNTWFTTESAMKVYLKNRESAKIPKKHRL